MTQVVEGSLCKHWGHNTSQQEQRKYEVVLLLTLSTISATSASAARDKADSFNICLSEYSVKENKAIRGELVDYCECLKAVEDKKQQTIETITVSVSGEI